MDISDWSVNAYLVFTLISSAVSVLGGLYLSIAGRQNPLDTKILIRGIWGLAIGAGVLALFRTQTIDNSWVILSAFWMLYAGGEGLIYLIGKHRVPIEPVYTEESKREDWKAARAKGRTRYLLRYVLVFSYGGLWGAVGIQLLFWDYLNILIPIAAVLAYAIWGYIEGANDWKRSEEEYAETP